MATWACVWCAPTTPQPAAPGSQTGPQHPLLNNNGDPDFVAKWGSGEWLPNHFEDSYQDVLPSLNLRLKLNPEVQLRFAASKAIARPSLDQLTANLTLGGDILTTYQPNPDPKLRR